MIVKREEWSEAVMQPKKGRRHRFERIALVLFDAEGWGHADIAAALGVPEGTVRSYVFHARRAMRKVLGVLAEGMK